MWPLGIHDNLDPQLLGIGPRALSLEENDWKAVDPEKARIEKVWEFFHFPNLERIGLCWICYKKNYMGWEIPGKSWTNWLDIALKLPSLQGLGCKKTLGKDLPTTMWIFQEKWWIIKKAGKIINKGPYNCIVF